MKNIKEQCCKIYSDAFGEDDFAIELFDKCFKHCRYEIVNDQVVSILFLLPCDVFVDNKSISSKYVFAVSTKKEYRNKGYAAKLLNSVKDECLLFLKPSNSVLVDFYKKLGYNTFKAKYSGAGEKHVVLSDDFFNLAKYYGRFDLNEYTAMYYYKTPINLNGLNFPYVME